LVSVIFEFEIMKTISIDILNEKAINLLKELEALKLIKMNGTDSVQQTSIKKKASDYKGIISSKMADEMNDYIRQSREEWRHRI
jgi:hypothetical protein